MSRHGKSKFEDYFKQIVTECLGCGHRNASDYCERYGEPARQWTRIGGCSMRTHRGAEQVDAEKFIDPLKASKRQARGI